MINSKRSPHETFSSDVMCAWNCMHTVSAFQTIIQILEGAVFKDVDGNKSKNGKLKGC